MATEKTSPLKNTYQGIVMVETNLPITTPPKDRVPRFIKMSDRTMPDTLDEVVKKAFEEICKERYTGQFEADAEYFPYVILREWSRFLDVRHFKCSFEPVSYTHLTLPTN